jgi:hypothetical protein
MSTTTARLLLSATAALLLLSGCSSPSADEQLPPDAGEAGEVDPGTTDAGEQQAPPLDIANLDACTVVTRTDAETLMGTALTDPLRAATSDVSSCTYPGDPNGPTAQVEVYIGPGVPKQLEIDRDTLAHAFEQPTGIGDEAWQEESMIFARRGDDWVSIRIVTLDDPAAFTSALQAAMTTALAQLP